MELPIPVGQNPDIVTVPLFPVPSVTTPPVEVTTVFTLREPSEDFEKFCMTAGRRVAAPYEQVIAALEGFISIP